jgi:hypothetical protein
MVECLVSQRDLTEFAFNYDEAVGDGSLEHEHYSAEDKA